MATISQSQTGQAMRALSYANEIRTERSRLRKRIAAGSLTVGEVIREVPDAARGWPISELLQAQDRWGNTRARRFLSRVRIGELKPVGTLTVRQRELVARLLEAPRTAAGEGEG